MKIVRALAAATAALALGVTVQVATSSPAAATDASARCIICWGVIDE